MALENVTENAETSKIIQVLVNFSSINHGLRMLKMIRLEERS